MTPGARLAAVIDLLSAAADPGQPVDRSVQAYLRARRYIGSKDRRVISDRVFTILRRRARLDWWCRRVGLDPDAPRALVLADLALAEDLEAAERTFDGIGYNPPALSATERAALADLSGRPLTLSEQEPWVRAECPAWVWPAFEAAFGAETEAELAALALPAGLDLRANTLKTARAPLRAELARAGIDSAATPFSPLGLRVAGRAAVTATPAFREGRVEIQDEGSQLLALLTDARPGLAVCDFCAGGGGKTLALGAAMAGEGRLVAADISARRLEAARPRLRRAGLPQVELRTLAGAETWLTAQAGRFDRILVDAPCSGTGTWRRSPEARWHLTEARLRELQSTQDAVLAQAAALVRPGGRLIYATCSLLQAENEARGAAFLAGHGAFRQVPVAEVWETVFTKPYPGPAQALTLTPWRHGTDGFHLAIFERDGAAAA